MKKAIWLCLALFLMLPLASCSGIPFPYTRYSCQNFECFDTVTTVTAEGMDGNTFDNFAKHCFDLLKEYHREYDIYHEYAGINNLKTVNEMAWQEPVPVSDKIIDLLEYGKEVYSLTNGKVNIAFGSVLSIWHTYREEGKEVPPMSLLEEAALHTDISKVILCDGMVFFEDSELRLDVGAIAKGYAAQKVAVMLQKEGYTDFLLNVGGNLIAVGTHQNKTPWTVTIENPTGDKSVGTYSLQGALVTSGSYQRFYEVDGIRYHHIINPDTLMPNNEFVSVSVFADDSALADALSTALFNLSLQEGRELAKKCKVMAIWITEDGTIIK